MSGAANHQPQPVRISAVDLEEQSVTATWGGKSIVLEFIRTAYGDFLLKCVKTLTEAMESKQDSARRHYNETVSRMSKAGDNRLKHNNKKLKDHWKNLDQMAYVYADIIYNTEEGFNLLLQESGNEVIKKNRALFIQGLETTFKKLRDGVHVQRTSQTAATGAAAAAIGAVPIAAAAAAGGGVPDYNYASILDQDGSFFNTLGMVEDAAGANLGLVRVKTAQGLVVPVEEAKMRHLLETELTRIQRNRELDTDERALTVQQKTRDENAKDVDKILELERKRFDHKKALEEEQLDHSILLQNKEFDMKAALGRKRRAEADTLLEELINSYVKAPNDQVAAVYEKKLVQHYEDDFKTKGATTRYVRSLRRGHKTAKHGAEVNAAVEPTSAYVFDNVQDEGVYHLTELVDADSIHYVGHSEDVNLRLQSHWSGQSGAAFVEGLTDRIPLITNEPRGIYRERAETEAAMRKYGIARVRGAGFASKIISYQNAFRNICISYRLCYKCGAAGHCTSTCSAPHFNRWNEPF